MFSEDGGFFSFFLLTSFLGPLLVVGLVVLGIVAISRADFDPTGRRAYAFYLYAVCFVALFTLVYSAVATVTSVSRFVGDDNGSIEVDDSGFSESSGSGSSSSSNFSGPDSSDTSELEGLLYDESISPESRRQLLAQLRAAQREGETVVGTLESDVRAAIDDERDDKIVRETVQVGLFGVVALAVLAFHWRRARKLAVEPGFAGSPAWRVFNAYLYVVCFVSVLVVLAAGAVAAYAGFRIVFPEITESVAAVDRIEREAGFRELASSGILLAIAALLALIHWRQIDRPPAVAVAGGSGELPEFPLLPPDSTYRRPDVPS